MESNYYIQKQPLQSSSTHEKTNRNAIRVTATATRMWDLNILRRKKTKNKGDSERSKKTKKYQQQKEFANW